MWTALRYVYGVLRSKIAIALAALSLAACTSTMEYMYVPVQGQTAQLSGYPATSYSLPPDSPEGSVWVAAMGTTKLSADSSTELPALQVRMLISNEKGAAPWTLDTRDVTMVMDGEGKSVPAFVNTDAGTPPVLSIAPGTRGTVDLYYPLPTGVDDADDLPGFSLDWKINASSRDLVERTSFQRVEVDTESYPSSYYSYPYSYDYAYPYPYPYGYAGVGFGVGLGAYWWYNPVYPYHAFVHRPVFAVPRHHWVGHPIVVSPYGHGYGHGWYGRRPGPYSGYGVHPHGGIHHGFHGGGFHPGHGHGHRHR